MSAKSRLEDFIQEHGQRAQQTCDEHGVAIFDIWHPTNMGGEILHFALMGRTCLSDNTFIMVKDERRID